MLNLNLREKLRSYTENNITKYPHRLHSGFYYTESVRSGMIEQGCGWVVDHIFALQNGQMNISVFETQIWEFKILPDRSVMLSCLDDKGHTVYYEHRAAVDYPRDDMRFVLDKRVLKILS